MKNNIIPFNDEALRWHLHNNIQNHLSDTAIEGIIKTVNQVNAGELNLEDELKFCAGVTIAEMLTDLKIEFQNQ